MLTKAMTRNLSLTPTANGPPRLWSSMVGLRVLRAREHIEPPNAGRRPCRSLKLNSWKRTTRLDVQEFWTENAGCEAFTTNKPRCALSFSPDDHWLFEFTHAPSTLRYYQDKAYRDQLHREANQVTSTYVGRTFFRKMTRGFTAPSGSRTCLAPTSPTPKAARPGWRTSPMTRRNSRGFSTAPRQPMSRSGPCRTSTGANGKRVGRGGWRRRCWARAAGGPPRSLPWSCSPRSFSSGVTTIRSSCSDSEISWPPR